MVFKLYGILPALRAGLHVVVMVPETKKPTNRNSWAFWYSW
jgi:hypothetical protein